MYFSFAFSMQRLKNQWSTFCIQSCIVLIHGPIGVPSPLWSVDVWGCVSCE